mmetsp:Transcript_2044/g.4138  ORF Transcript_2044/g.4138 Transcript_2044/m.4138 type:complete len:474 (+) Transcript_2044:536-1957(+)|eukprot:CAMPEP_0168743852 /NCGR_PEP_ID=MMETSP0724-20121128/13792_1 /TAXON_ID=265536 /ORGANISM="Amphiprora sp., Strain CCMP467" /LENGTH=473 /DNA_ID=CAMNT_0008791499 /DNA_START=437 /DNA_END=1858 /DNA_ORIENTATION=-
MDDPKYQLHIPPAIQDARRPEALPLPKHYTLGILDVGCGRGQRYCNHVGNQRFRSIVAEHVETYLRAKTKLAKTALIVSILEQVKKGTNDQRSSSSQPGDQGRFVKQNEDGSWVELCDSAARDKVSNALRSAVALYRGGEGNSNQGDKAATDLRRLSQSSCLSECGETKKSRKKTNSGLDTVKKQRRSKPKQATTSPKASSSSSTSGPPTLSVPVDSLRRVEERMQVVAALTKYHQLLASRAASVNTVEDQINNNNKANLVVMEPLQAAVNSDDSTDESSILVASRSEREEVVSPARPLKRRVSTLSSSDETLHSTKKKQRTTPALQQVSPFTTQATILSTIDYATSASPSLVPDAVVGTPVSTLTTPLAPKTTVSPTSVTAAIFPPFLSSQQQQPVVTPRENDSAAAAAAAPQQLLLLPTVTPEAAFAKQQQQKATNDAIIADLNAVATLLLIKQSNQGSLLTQPQTSEAAY